MSEVKYTFTKENDNRNHSVANKKNICWKKTHKINIPQFFFIPKSIKKVQVSLGLFSLNTNNPQFNTLYYMHPQAMNGFNSIYAEYYKIDSLGSLL